MFSSLMPTGNSAAREPILEQAPKHLVSIWATMFSTRVLAGVQQAFIKHVEYFQKRCFFRNISKRVHCRRFLSLTVLEAKGN